MSQANYPPSLNGMFKDIKTRIKALEISSNVSTFTVASRPAAPAAPCIIFVSDATSGAQFQGWNGTGWVNLG